MLHKLIMLHKHKIYVCVA